MASNASQLNYRLFAKLLMFLTFFFGGLVGYFFGFEMGKQEALELLEKGRMSANTEAIGARSNEKSTLEMCVEAALGTNSTAYRTGQYAPTQAEYQKMQSCF